MTNKTWQSYMLTGRVLTDEFVDGRVREIDRFIGWISFSAAIAATSFIYNTITITKGSNLCDIKEK